MLKLQNISVSIDDKEVVHNLSLSIQRGSIIALMGPNGSGKSSLINAVMGHPHYIITGGQIILDDKDITTLLPHEKARKGIFLSLQNPPVLPGVTVSSFLRNACSALIDKKIPVLDFKKTLEKAMQDFNIPVEMARRHVNEGFSGGEKKRLEALQLSLIKPTFALLDETDAGLDIDALHIIAQNIKRMAPEMGILIITHYTRILDYLTPDEVHVMQGGRIVQSGGGELADEIENNGYKKFYA